MEVLRDALAALFIKITLFERSEFVIFMNDPSRQVILLELPNDEAVANPIAFLLRHPIQECLPTLCQI